MLYSLANVASLSTMVVSLEFQIPTAHLFHYGIYINY